MQMIDMPGLMIRRARARRAQGKEWRWAAPVCVVFAVAVVVGLTWEWIK